MARLKNRTTGVTINVSDEVAALMGPEWQKAAEKQPTQRGKAKADKADAAPADDKK